MRNETQIRKQMASWITNERWSPLLNWFNQNKSKIEDWNILFDEATKYNIQEKWPRYIDFFEKHLANIILFSSQTKRQECFWTLCNIAFPRFFEKAIPLLSPEQRHKFRKEAMDWIVPWWYKKESNDVGGRKESVATTFKLLIGLDALDEWSIIKHSVHVTYIPGLLKYTFGKDLQWEQDLRKMYIAEGNTVDSWRLVLFDNDCVEHLLSEDNPLPMAHALLEYAANVHKNDRHITSEKVLADTFRRRPYLRFWVQQASGEDAQACRSILEIPEINTTKSDVSKAIDIGKSLGLEFNELACLLSPVVLQIDNMLIEPNFFKELLSEDTPFKK